MYLAHTLDGETVPTSFPNRPRRLDSENIRWYQGQRPPLSFSRTRIIGGLWRTAMHSPARKLVSRYVERMPLSFPIVPDGLLPLPGSHPPLHSQIISALHLEHFSRLINGDSSWCYPATRRILHWRKINPPSWSMGKWFILSHHPGAFNYNVIEFQVIPLAIYPGG